MSSPSRSLRHVATATLTILLLAPFARAHEGHDGPELGPNDPHAPRRLSEAAIRNGEITLAAVGPHAIERVIEVPGRVIVRPDAAFDVHAPIEGVIVSIDVAAGQPVAAGAVVARIGGGALAGLVGEWERASREAAAEKRALDALRTLVDLQAIAEIETRRAELVTTAAVLASAEIEKAAVEGAGALPARDVRTREATVREARARHDAARTRLLAAGLTSDELGRLATAPGDRPVSEALGVERDALARRAHAVAPQAADLLDRERAAETAAAALAAVTLRLRLSGISTSDVADLSKAAEPSIPLRTPIAGIVRTLSVNRGHWVTAGQEIAVIVDPSATSIEAAVPESEFGRVATATAARIRRGGRPDLLIEGTVVTVGPAVDAATHRFPVWISLPPTAHLPIDLGVDVTIVLERAADVKSVPLTAVLTEGAERYVFKMKDGLFVRTEIALGIRDDRLVQVLDGLYSGEQVVATGAELVRDTPGAPAVPKASPSDAKPAVAPVPGK